MSDIVELALASLQGDRRGSVVRPWSFGWIGALHPRVGPTRALWVLACCLVLPARSASAQGEFPGTDPTRCAAMSADGVEVFAYEVRRGDGCGRISQRVYGDRHREDLVHAFNPDMGAPPHRLRPGTYVCLPRSIPPPPPPAHITAIRQQVRERPPEQPAFRPAVLGQTVARGARVDVRERAFAELTFRDTSTLVLRGDTLVVVYGDAEQTAREASHAELERGALRARLGELRGRIRTPTAVVGLAGGAAVASVDGEATTRLSNHEGGAAEVTDIGGRGVVRVPPNRGSEVRRGAAPTPPRPLPDAPRWSASQPARFLSVPAASTVRGAWLPVSNARTYRVELARAPDGGQLAAAVEVPAAVTRFEIHQLPPGTYHARVSTIGQDLFESRPSEPWTFEVVAGTLEGHGLEGGVLADEAVLDEVPPLAIWPGTRLTPPAGIRCGAADVIVLATPGPLSLPCRDAENRTVGLFHGVIRPMEMGLADTDHATVQQGAHITRMLLVPGAAALPETATVTGSAGFAVLSATRREDGFEVELSVAEDAREGTLVLALDDVTLARVALTAVAREVAQAEPDAPAVRLPPPEAFGVAPMPSLIGLRRARVDGLGGWIAAATHGGEPGRVRSSLGLRAGVLDRSLQIELATTYDFGDDFARTGVRGSGDLWAAGAYATVVGPLEIVAELGAFVPTQPGDGGLGAMRLLPSLHLAAYVFDRLWLRTRQALFADLDERANLGWASAYGVDVEILGPLSLGAELGMSLGQEDADLLALATLGGHLSLLTEHFTASVAARAGFWDHGEAIAGPWSLIMSIGFAGLDID